VASQKMLMLYHFHLRTHDISRLRVIDFEESGVYVELSLCPSSLSLAEDIIMCMAEEFVHVFRLGPPAQGGDQRHKSDQQQRRDGERVLTFCFCVGTLCHLHQGLCHSSGGQLLASFHGSPGLIPSHTMCDLLHTQLHWVRYVTLYFGVPQSTSFFQCYILMLYCCIVIEVYSVIK
jgi:hypothetical protein